MYHLGLGRLFGHRFLLLVHRGRRTGKTHETVLEVVATDPSVDEWFVIAAWGQHADWLRNLEAGPTLEVIVGAQRFAPTHRFVSTDEALGVLQVYQRAHPRAWRVIARLFGWPPNPTTSDLQRVVAHHPLVAFRPSGAAPGRETVAPARVTRSKEAARRNYDRRSRGYERVEGRFEARLRRAGVDRLAPSAGERILEIGYGTGVEVVQLARAVGVHGHVDGIDLSPGMRDVAQARVSRANLSERVQLAIGDALQLPYPDRAFDALYTSFTLELFDTPELPAVLTECHRVLRAGGRIAVVALALPDRAMLMVRAYLGLHQLLPALVDCRPIPIAKLLNDAGFADVNADHRSLIGLPVDIVLARRADLPEGGGRACGR
jgi:deazaflavin-dependent oxidoreductase (nitroreductase family)